MCGICKLGLRDGTTPEAVRVGDEGADVEVLKALKIEGRIVAPGLYASCPECTTVIKPFCAKRIHKQLTRDERINAAIEDREQRPIPAPNPADLSANDLC
jgi:hypothetical protein